MTSSDQIDQLAALGSYWCGLWQWPGLFVSDDGRVASVRSGKARVLRGTRSGKYLAFAVADKHPYVHQTVCEVFHGPRPVGCEVRHLDGNRLNNAAWNLAWGTRSENRADQVRHGTDVGGARNPSAKLTAEAVQQMRLQRVTRGMSYQQLGRAFGVTTMTAFRAVRGQSWK